MLVSRSLILIVAAVFCFLIALLVVLNVFNGDAQAWELGGLLALAASFLPGP